MVFSLNDSAGKKVLCQEITVSFQNIIYPQLRLHFKGTYPGSPLWDL